MYINRYLLVLVFSLATTVLLFGQPNLVPNPGFELRKSPPPAWFYNHRHFAEALKYWHSPTGASPDAYGLGIQVPADWKEKGFGDIKPHGGKGMIGLTLYGCTGKPHCREYAAILLAEPLVPAQTYYVEFWTARMPRSMRTNRLGIYFTKEKIQRITDDLIDVQPQVEADEIINVAPYSWMKVSGTFVAHEASDYLILGNFRADNQTKAIPADSAGFKYAYYYFDDILVKKLPPYLVPPTDTASLNLLPFAKGKTIQLKNIYFDFDSHELHPRSYVELKKLMAIMRKYPKLTIEISGHTDNAGSDTYNLKLSQKRAETTIQYLRTNGISSSRLQAKGYGESKPIASNDTEEGMAQNRRVELKILKY